MQCSGQRRAYSPAPSTSTDANHGDGADDDLHKHSSRGDRTRARDQQRHCPAPRAQFHVHHVSGKMKYAHHTLSGVAR